MRRLFSFLLLTLPFCVMAQEDNANIAVDDSAGLPTELTEIVVPKFGVIDYEGVLELMPEWKVAQAQLDSLRARYNAESERAEREFQRKFAEFLEGQSDFPKNIMEKRQKELQCLLEESVSFRQSVQKLLRQAEADYTANARRRLDSALKVVASEHRLLFIFNVSGNQVPYVDEERIMDVKSVVLEMLKL